MKRFFCIVTAGMVGIILVALLSSCGKAPNEQQVKSAADTSPQEETAPSSQQDLSDTSLSDHIFEIQSTQTAENEEVLNNKLTVQVNGQTFTASLENNEAVDVFVKMLEKAPVTIEMSDYSGFEKVGALDADLPTSNSQMTTQPGDIVLYQGNQIVMFYGSNSWSYTMLGKIDDLTGWEEALGDGTVTVVFSIEE